MTEELSKEEETVLTALFPDRRLWYREFHSEYEIADKPLRRVLKRLQRSRYIVKDKPQEWKRGMKIPYYLTRKGKHIAARLVIGEKGRDLFTEVLERIVAISNLHNDEGEKVLELALDIVNMLDDKEKSISLRDALCELVGELT
jgi:DNA-binding PadR family transcriptional regulator